MKIKTIKDIRSFTIDRSKWVRGDIGGDSALLNGQGNMCCLGHYSKACGISDNNLQDSAGPSDVLDENILNKNQLGKAWLANYRQESIEIVDWKSKLFKVFFDDCPDYQEFAADNSIICENLMSINDDLHLTEVEREKDIKAQFAKMGVKVKFIN